MHSKSLKKKPCSRAKAGLWFTQTLLKWFAVHGRHDLPWQHPRTPYAVWVSEIMLQQTQVKTVIPYFLRFMRHFPNIEKLANSPLDEVLALWTGLGYYARARNLHKTACTIWREYAGNFPDTVASWSALPGIGLSTAGAIVSQAYDKPAPILDANVKRVFMRFYGLKGSPNDKVMVERLWEIADTHLPSTQNINYTQALMDLGATICGRTPQCTLCPLQKKCASFSTQTFQEPIMQKRRPKKHAVAYYGWFQKGEAIWLEQNPEKGIWGGLWGLPTLATAPKQKPIFKGTHSFTHIHLEYSIYAYPRLPSGLAKRPLRLFTPQDVKAIGLNRLTQKALEKLWLTAASPLTE